MYSHFTGTRLHWWQTDPTTGAIIDGQVFGNASSPVQAAFPSGTPAISANGTASGVVWTAPGNTNPARIYAHDAQTGQLLLNQAISSGGTGQSYLKFSVPAVVNGQVYLGLQAGIAVLRFPQ